MTTQKQTANKEQNNGVWFAWHEEITPTFALLAQLTEDSGAINIKNIADATAHYNDLLNISEDYIFAGQSHDMSQHLETKIANLAVIAKEPEVDFNQCKMGRENCLCDPLNVLSIPIVQTH